MPPLPPSDDEAPQVSAVAPDTLSRRSPPSQVLTARSYAARSSTGGEPDEETPLLPEENYKRICQDFVPPDPSVLREWMYEPMTEDYRAENPAPFLLLLQHLGMAVIEMMGVMGCFAFLTANAEVTFQKCSDFRLIDRLFTVNTGHGWLCEISSLALWTFPIYCLFIIPLFQFWDLLDSRIYYECLRRRLFIQRVPTHFHASPIVFISVGYLLLAMSSMLFAMPGTWKAMSNKINGMLPFMIPVISFFIAMYAGWDLRFKFITLSSFIMNDFDWATHHVKNGDHADSNLVQLAFVRLKAEGELAHGEDVILLFEKLRMKIRELKEDEGLLQRLEGEGDDYQEIKISTWGKFRALACDAEGFWVKDLLWLLQDARARHFRLVFRVSQLLVCAVEVAVLYALLCTVTMYLSMQGHLNPASVPRPLMILRELMVVHS